MPMSFAICHLSFDTRNYLNSPTVSLLPEQGDDQQHKQRQQDQNALGLLKFLHVHIVLHGRNFYAMSCALI
jgi:hypothetical protein